MAVVGTPKLVNNKTANWSIRDGVKRTYNLSYLVEVDSQDDDPTSFLGHTPGLPYWGDHYPCGSGDPYATLLDLAVEEVSESGQYLYRVNCVFETADPRFAVGDPLAMAPKIYREYVNEDVIIDQDTDGVPILNSAGQPYSDPIIEQYARTVYVVEVNRQFVDSMALESWRKTVNLDDFAGFPAETLLLESLTDSPAYAPETGGYWKLVFKFKVDLRHKWVKRPLDQGYQEWKGGKLLKIIGSNGQPLDEPGLLDGEGGYLGAGPDAAANAVFNTHSIYPKLDFTQFGLPPDLNFAAVS